MGGRHIAEDDDAVWEQLAADIQASEQVQRAEAAPAGEGRSSAEGQREAAAAAAAPPPQGPGTAAPQQRQQQQDAASDEQLQAAMQEAAMEGALRGWEGWLWPAGWPAACSLHFRGAVRHVCVQHDLTQPASPPSPAGPGRADDDAAGNGNGWAPAQDGAAGGGSRWAGLKLAVPA